MTTPTLNLTSPAPLCVARENRSYDNCDVGYRVNTPARLTNDVYVVFFRHLLVNLELYLVPLIVLVGVIGNTLSFVVFVATHLKRNSCHIYLASLAIADNAFLLLVLISWSARLGVPLYNRRGWCQLLAYLMYVSSFLSVWYVVTFTLERYIAVCFPLKRNVVCIAKVAKRAVISLSALALVGYFFVLFMFGVVELHGRPLCAPLPEYFQVMRVVNNVDTLVTLIIPTVLITGCNIRITYVVCTFYKQAKHDVGQLIRKWDFSQRAAGFYRPSLHDRSARRPVSISASRTSHMRATRMLLIVSTVFLVCNLPRHAARTYTIVKKIVDPKYQPSMEWITWLRLFQIVYYINFAVNVFLYSLSGRSFRTGLCRLRTKIGKKLRNISCRRRGNDESPTNSPKYDSSKTAFE
ncbi:hypothetical protein NP493_1854g00012 [Ridgeia piscesae]|uniref:G-protein coupled receptors family 1 profile domain-containing protein n=1 Tax=Ridgeia piscesae TaxID=27915 RepID=A0AAD9JQR9_RIDPI|nr:hypothetical protein NP493_1854g00012 [Ridgeia piscesae]